MIPAQMFDRRLNPIKGWPSPYALDKAGQVSDAEADQGLVAGMVMHIDSVTALFKRGLPANEVPVFAWNGFSNFDTMGADDGNISLYGNKKGVSGLVGLGSFELQTTEFVDDVYAPNTPLAVDNTATVDLGKVKPGAFYTDTIVGVVSDGLSTNAHGREIVTFWTYFLPATA